RAEQRQPPLLGLAARAEHEWRAQQAEQLEVDVAWVGRVRHPDLVLVREHLDRAVGCDRLALWMSRADLDVASHTVVDPSVVAGRAFDLRLEQLRLALVALEHR